MNEHVEEVCIYMHPEDANHILAEWTQPGDAELTHPTPRAQRTREMAAVLLVQIDDFCDITDRCGEDARDEVVRRVAERLDMVRGTTSHQLSDDVFVIVANSLLSRFEALTVARRVQRHIAQLLVFAQCEIALSASIGVRVALDDARDPAELLLDAAVALSAAKERGRGEVALFSIELRDRRRQQPS